MVVRGGAGFEGGDCGKGGSVIDSRMGYLDGKNVAPMMVVNVCERVRRMEVVVVRVVMGKERWNWRLEGQADDGLVIWRFGPRQGTKDQTERERDLRPFGVSTGSLGNAVTGSATNWLSTRDSCRGDPLSL